MEEIPKIGQAFCLPQRTAAHPDGVRVECLGFHSGGQWFCAQGTDSAEAGGGGVAQRPNQCSSPQEPSDNVWKHVPSSPPRRWELLASADQKLATLLSLPWYHRVPKANSTQAEEPPT